MDTTISPSYPTSEESQRAANVVAFHKHCQRTVLSAYGPEGEGATWNVINGVTGEHLPTNWKEGFRNTENITQDLASILRLMDNVAESMYNQQFKLTFTDAAGQTIAEKLIKPMLDQDTNYKFNLDREITLEVNGQQLRFRALSQGPSDNTQVTIPTKTLAFTQYGNELDSAQVAMDKDLTIEVGSNHDNTGNYSQESEFDTMPIVVTDEASTYRISTDENVTPDLDLAWYGDHESGFVKFSIIVENTGDESILVDIPTVVQDDIFVNPIFNDGKIMPGFIGVFKVVVDLKSKILFAYRETEYVTDPAILSIFTFDDGTKFTTYLAGDITQQSLRNAGLLDSELGWIRHPVDIRIGRTVTGIGENAFAGCSDLVSIGANLMARDVQYKNMLPDSVTWIGENAFQGCSSLVSIGVPNSVQTIGFAAFSGCVSLVSMELPFVGISRVVEDDGEEDTKFKGLFGVIFDIQEDVGLYLAT